MAFRFKKIAFLSKKTRRSATVAAKTLDYLEKQRKRGMFEQLFIEDATSYFLNLKQARHSLNEIRDSADCMVIVGGDGTFLSSEYSFPGIPKLGINTGSVGFLPNLSVNYLEEGLELFFSNKFSIEKRAKISCSCGKRSIDALNDISIFAKNPARAIKLEVSSKNFTETFLGNGIVFATPTGSTAYSLSVGGPIVYPSVNCIIASPISPVNPMLRPMVFPTSEKFMVKVLDRTALVSADGISPERFYEGEISASKEHANLITIQKEQLWNRLKRKQLSSPSG